MPELETRILNQFLADQAKNGYLWAISELEQTVSHYKTRAELDMQALYKAHLNVLWKLYQAKG